MPKLHALLPYAVSMLVFGLLLSLDQTLTVALKHAGIYSGIFLTICFLICFYWDWFAKNNRVVHTQIGLLSIALFLLHIDFTMPDGKLELALTLFFVVLAVSGLFGAFVSAVLTKRLSHMPTKLSQNNVFEQRELLRAKAEEILLSAIKNTHSELIEQLYLHHLQVFFGGLKNTFAHLFGISETHLYPFTFIEMAHKNGTADEKEFIVQLSHIALQKYNVDKQYTLQQANSFWRLVHQKTAWCLMVLVVLHSLLVISFAGLVL